MSDKRVLVLGLDGADFRVLDPLIDSGLMPHLEELIKGGVRGDLLSTMPPVTGPAWASFLTGKNPGKHGIFDFVKRAPGGHGREVINSSDIHGHTLWSILNHHGMKVGVLNMPVSYPPPPVDSFIVSGLLTPGKDGTYTYPERIGAELERLVGDYMIDVKWQHYQEGEEERLLADIERATLQKKEAAIHLFEEFAWNLGIVIFEGPDRLQHALWDYFGIDDGGRLKSKRAGKIRERIRAYYSQLDEALGSVIEAAGNNTDVYIISDHGFGVFEDKFFINRWLELNGWLKSNTGSGVSLKLKDAVRRVISDIPVLQRKYVNYRKSRINHRDVYGFLHRIEWPHTRAYAASNTEQGVYLNVAGREANGIVQPGDEYEAMRERLIGELASYEDPQTGEKLFTEIYKREDIYSGPFVDQAPDIVYVLSGGKCLANARFRSHLFERRRSPIGSGTHRSEGVLIAFGQGIKQGVVLGGARILDMAPTIIYSLGLPIPPDMDGVCLEAAFTDENLAERKPVIGAELPRAETQEQVLTDAEAEKVKDQLKGLGYLG